MSCHGHGEAVAVCATVVVRMLSVIADAKTQIQKYFELYNICTRPP